MGRQAHRRVRQLVAAILVAACGSPPGATPIDAGSDAATGPIDAATLADAALPDAAPAPDAHPDNPLGIALVDVTDGLGAVYLGGRSADDTWGVGSGVTLADVDGDGHLDVLLARIDDPASGRPGGPAALLRGGPGGLTALAEDPAFAARFAGLRVHAMAAADYDADGDIDVFAGVEGADVLLVNDGTGAFTDATGLAGVGGPADDITVGAIWADVNADGLLDLYVLSHTGTNPPSAAPGNANRLYLNAGGGEMVDVSSTSGAAGDGSSQAAAIADLDGDGALEIYVANDQFAVDGNLGLSDSGLDEDALYDPVAFDDQGRPTFVDRAASAGVGGPRSSMGVALIDLDRDGFDDVYVSDWGTNHVQVWQPASSTYDTDSGLWGLALHDSGPEFLYVSWSARFVDLDRDGLEEAFVVNGAVTEPIGCDSQRQLDALLRRPATGPPFVDVTGLVGLPSAQLCPMPAGVPIQGRGAAFGDLDGDGDDDLVVSPYVEAYRFYRNDTPADAGHFVRVRLRGTVSSPDPVGARVRATLPGGDKRARTLYGGGDTHSQSDRVVELGLGEHDTVEDARVTWPSGLSQRIDGRSEFAIDAPFEVVEPDWLRVSARVVDPADPVPILTYEPVDTAGEPLGPAGAGRTVAVARSDGTATAVVDNGDGTYTAALPHPGAARTTVLLVTVDGALQRPRLTVRYR